MERRKEQLEDIPEGKKRLAGNIIRNTGVFQRIKSAATDEDIRSLKGELTELRGLFSREGLDPEEVEYMIRLLRAAIIEIKKKIGSVTPRAWDGKDRRSARQIPGLAPIKIAERALEEGYTADDMFVPEDKLVRAGDIADLNISRQVDSILKASQVDYSEIGQLVTKLVDDQYANRLGKLKARGLYDPENPKEGDVPPPTPEQAKDILKRKLTPDQLEVIKGMKKPVFQLVPVTSMARYVQSMNGHKPMSEQIDAYVAERSRGALERADKKDNASNVITGWRIAVTEGEKEPAVLEGDDLKKTLRERDAWFKQEYGKKGATGVDFKRMLLLEQDSLEDGDPINDFNKPDGTWTFVNEEPENSGSVAGVAWDDGIRQVSLNGDSSDNRNDLARFRASVVVDVPRA